MATSPNEVVEILQHLGDVARFPHVCDAMRALREAHGLTLKQMGERMEGVTRERARQLEACTSFETASARKYALALGLSEQAVGLICAEVLRRKTIKAQGGTFFRKQLAVVMEYWGIKDKQLEQEIGESVCWHVTNKWGNSLLEYQVKAIGAIGRIIRDPNYDMEQFYREAKHAMRKNNDAPSQER